MNKHSFATVIIVITFTVVSIIGIQSHTSLNKKVEILTNKLEESNSSSELKLDQLLGGMMFLNRKLDALYNIEIMRFDPELPEKMKEYNKGFQQNEGIEDNEKDAFNRFIPTVPTDETER